MIKPLRKGQERRDSPNKTLNTICKSGCNSKNNKSSSNWFQQKKQQKNKI